MYIFYAEGRRVWRCFRHEAPALARRDEIAEELLEQAEWFWVHAGRFWSRSLTQSEKDPGYYPSWTPKILSLLANSRQTIIE